MFTSMNCYRNKRGWVSKWQRWSIRDNSKGVCVLRRRWGTGQTWRKALSITHCRQWGAFPGWPCAPGSSPRWKGTAQSSMPLAPFSKKMAKAAQSRLGHLKQLLHTPLPLPLCTDSFPEKLQEIIISSEIHSSFKGSTEVCNWKMIFPKRKI